MTAFIVSCAGLLLYLAPGFGDFGRGKVGAPEVPGTSSRNILSRLVRGGVGEMIQSKKSFLVSLFLLFCKATYLFRIKVKAVWQPPPGGNSHRALCPFPGPSLGI